MSPPSVTYKKSKLLNVPKLLQKAQVVARSELTDAVDEYVHDELDEFVGRIEDQRFASFRKILYPDSGTNLSPAWLGFKMRHDLDLRTMIATGHYMDSIKVFAHNRGKKAREWKIGFRADAMARDKDGKNSGITLDLLARVHEHGSARANVPARPHWKPNLNRMKREAPKRRQGIRDRVVAKIKKELKVG